MSEDNFTLTTFNQGVQTRYTGPGAAFLGAVEHSVSRSSVFRVFPTLLGFTEDARPAVLKLSVKTCRAKVAVI